MPQSIATAVYALGIGALFVLDRDRKARTSPALWIPVVWLWIVGSREVSQWLAIAGFGNAVSSDSAESSLEGNAVDRIVYTCLIVLGLVVLVRRGPKVWRLLRANAPILLFFSFCAISVLWSDFPSVAFKRWTKAVGDLVMIMIVLTDRDWLAALKRLLARVGFLLIPLSVLFIKYYPDLSRNYKFWSGKSTYLGITTTKNLLGMICLVFGLGSLWRFLVAYRNREDTHRVRRLVAHGVLLAMVVWLLRMSNSMTSLSCLLLASVLMTATSFRTVTNRPWVIHLLVAVVVSVSVSVLFLNVGGSALEEMGRDRSLTGRTAIWDLALSLAGNPLCGTGFESFWLGWRLEKVWSIMKGIQEAHNGYLEVYLNLGWMGITLLGIIIVTGYRRIFVAFRRNPDTNRLWLTYFVVALVYNFTEAGFRMMFPVWIFFLMAIMAVTEIRESHRKPPTTNSAIPTAHWEEQMDHLVTDSTPQVNGTLIEG